MTPNQLKLKPTSFRGVPFFVETAEAELVRRVTIHEYPFRDTATAEDLGKKPRSFSITAYLGSADIEPQRTALINACYETAGAGLLVHPTLGQLTAVCTGFSYSWDKSVSGYEAYNLTFVEANNAPSPVATVNTQATTLLAAEGLAQQSQTTFAKTFSVANSNSNTIKAALQGHNHWLNGFKTALTTLGKGLASLQKAIKTIELTVNSLLADPKAYAKSIYGLYLDVNKLVVPYKLKALFWRQFIGQLRKPVATPFDSSVAVANTQALMTLTHSLALAGLATALASQPYTTHEEATEALTEATNQFNQQELVLMASFQDEALAPLSHLKTQVITDLRERGQQLPVLNTIVLPQNQPAVVLAWDLYADATQADAIVQRNGVTHAGFLPANTPIKVLALQ
jgi:prophage DNA circulation protein